MGLESLHNYIKRKKLKGVAVNRVDKVLLVLREVVQEKIWKNIVHVHRPNNDTYQGRQISKFHKAALIMKTPIVTSTFGCFRIGPFDVKYAAPFCDASNCSLQCTACKVCMHIYTCNCVTFSVKGMPCM